MYKNLVPAGALALAAVCFSSPAFSQPTRAPGEPVKAGFVYVSPITDAGWMHQHDEGRKAVEAALGSQVKTTFVENVAEGADAERVIRDLARQGHQIIFTPSFGYMEPTLKVAKEFPDVKFESITGYKTAPNVAAANARYYEGPLPGRHRRRAHDADQSGGLRGGLSDSRGAAGHQRLHAGHALGEPEGRSQGGLAQRLVRPAARSATRP